MTAATLPAGSLTLPFDAAASHRAAEPGRAAGRRAASGWLPRLSLAADSDYLCTVLPNPATDSGSSEPFFAPSFDADLDAPAAQSASRSDADGEPAETPAARPDGLRGRLDEAALAALVPRIADHDENALAMLYDQTASRVLGLALRITRERATAEEVVEDCFWQAWREAPRFDGVRGSVINWLLSMARSRAIDALRRHARHAEHELAVDGDMLQTLAVHADGAGDGLDAAERGERLQCALAELDPLSRQLLTLAFFHGLSHAEVAGHTMLPLGTVKSHIRRALLALRARLAGESIDPNEV